jgi:hypothetical protein
MMGITFARRPVPQAGRSYKPEAPAVPLKKGRSKADVSSNISEFHQGQRYQAIKRKSGKSAADKAAVAAALKKAGKSRKK